MRSSCKGQLDFAKNPLKAFTKFNHIVLDAIILSLVGKEFKYILRFLILLATTIVK